MLTKESIIKSFNEDDAKDAIKIYEKYKIAYEKDITIFTNKFYPPNIWKYFEDNCSTNNFLIESNGFFDESERRIIAFNNIYNMEYPIKILEIKNKSNFSSLKHKDYLGSILALGIERNKIGDIVVRENKAYLPVIYDISDYIIDNLFTIGKSPVKVKLIDDLSNIPQAEFEESVINVASLRIDSVVAKITNISRTKSIELIDSGKVLVDYVRARDKSQEIIKGSRLTIRGNGKYIVGNIVGETRSGKQKVEIKKYI